LTSSLLLLVWSFPILCWGVCGGRIADAIPDVHDVESGLHCSISGRTTEDSIAMLCHLQHRYSSPVSKCDSAYRHSKDTQSQRGLATQRVRTPKTRESRTRWIPEGHTGNFRPAFSRMQLAAAGRQIRLWTGKAPGSSTLCAHSELEGCQPLRCTARKSQICGPDHLRLSALHAISSLCSNRIDRASPRPVYVADLRRRVVTPQCVHPQFS
jgi:hypothetical protein